MRKDILPPYLGAAYYPEAWDIKEIGIDIDLMKQAGLNLVRIAEFAWSTMEKKEKDYNFDLFNIVLNRLMNADIGVIMCTPSATPPAWLTEKYPEMLTVNDMGIPTHHGGRRHACSNNPHYIEYTKKIVNEMGKEFGSHENILGWQIDNEIYLNGKGCFCPVCRKKFTEFLSEKYNNDIEKLNAAWDLALWSQAYNSFDQIPAPWSTAWQNPHLQLEWILFQAKSHIDYIHLQAEILKQYTNAPISTDMMPFGALDYEKMNEPLDMVQFNHYNSIENLQNVLLWFDYIRTIKDNPFWNTETATGWSGSTAIWDNFKPEGFCRLNSWLPIALGGEANLYWLWRSHWGGHELMHGSVISSAARPLHMFKEVQQLSSDFKKTADFINNTKVTTKAAMHFTSLSWNMFETQPVVGGLNYQDSVFKYFYKPITEDGIRLDVIGSGHELDDYKVIFSPLVITLEENKLDERIEKWVNDGGIWIAGPLTDIRDIKGAKYKDSPFGMLENIGKEFCKYQFSDKQQRITSMWSDGSPFKGDLWYDVFDLEGIENSLVKITDGYSVLKDKSVVTVNKSGKGAVITLGTFPSYDDMKKLLKYIYSISDLKQYDITGDIAVIPREGTNEKGEFQKGIIFCEYNGKKGSVILEKPMLDILNDKMVSDVVDIEPYGVLVLKEI